MECGSSRPKKSRCMSKDCGKGPVCCTCQEHHLVQMHCNGFRLFLIKGSCWEGVYGNECKFRSGKSIRDGQSQMTLARASEGLSLSLQMHCLIVDAIRGIIKANVGIKCTKIVGIVKAGNSDMMDGGVGANMIVGATTEVIGMEN